MGWFIIKSDIIEKCHINNNKDKDIFVGIKCIDGDISINFPMGYHLGETEE